MAVTVDKATLQVASGEAAGQMHVVKTTLQVASGEVAGRMHLLKTTLQVASKDPRRLPISIN